MYVYRLQFLKLQTDLLEEFKHKIIECEYESNEHLLQKLCTLHYVSYILYNWGTNMVSEFVVVIIIILNSSMYNKDFKILFILYVW